MLTHFILAMTISLAPVAEPHSAQHTEAREDLQLQFGQSIIQSPAGWTLDPDSTNEHLRIIFEPLPGDSDPAV